MIVSILETLYRNALLDDQTSNEETQVIDHLRYAVRLGRIQVTEALYA